jgi:hypothetical protein
MKAVARVFIRRTPDEVFAFATDWSNYQKWQQGVEESAKTSAGPNAVGTTFRHVSRFMGRHVKVTGEVIECEPGRSFAYRVTSGNFRYSGRQTFQPRDEGTEATYAFDAEMPGLMRLGQPLMRWFAERRIAGDYDRLKALMERQGDV